MEQGWRRGRPGERAHSPLSRSIVVFLRCATFHAPKRPSAVRRSVRKGFPSAWPAPLPPAPLPRPHKIFPSNLLYLFLLFLFLRCLLASLTAYMAPCLPTQLAACLPPPRSVVKLLPSPAFLPSSPPSFPPSVLPSFLRSFFYRSCSCFPGNFETNTTSSKVP